MSKKKGYRAQLNQDGSVKCWRVDITLGGKRFTPTCATEDVAIATVASLKDQHERGIALIPTAGTRGITIKEAFEQCYNDPEIGWMNTDHGKKQKYYAQSFYNFWGAKTPLTNITKKMWYEYTAQFQATATNNRRASCINKLFNYAVENGTIAPSDRLKIKRAKEKLSRLYAFSRSDEKAIKDACEQLGYDDLKDFITVLIDTGARAEELLQASARDFQYFSDGSFTLNLYHRKTGTEGNIGLKKRSQEILSRRSNSARFFMGSYKHYYRRFQHVKKILNKTTDKNWSFHVCRHTCASRMAEAGIPLAKVAAWLGHAPNSPVTSRYIHFYGAGKIDIAKTMDEFDTQLDNSENVIRIAVGDKK